MTLPDPIVHDLIRDHTAGDAGPIYNVSRVPLVRCECGEVLEKAGHAAHVATLITSYYEGRIRDLETYSHTHKVL